MRRGVYYPHLYIVKEDGEPPLRLWALSALVQDRADVLPSYQQFIGSLKEKVSTFAIVFYSQLGSDFVSDWISNGIGQWEWRLLGCRLYFVGVWYDMLGIDWGLARYDASYQVYVTDPVPPSKKVPSCLFVCCLCSKTLFSEIYIRLFDSLILLLARMLCLFGSVLDVAEISW